MKRSLTRSPRVQAASAGAVLSLAWLIFTATPVFADGGPHVVATNSGIGAGSTLTADSCAGCHRAHSGQGSDLIAAPSADALCTTCHGSGGAGATTNVENGVQYALGAGNIGRGAEAGALRSGGFLTARIDSGRPSRIVYGSIVNGVPSILGSAFVPALSTGRSTTSAHIALNTALVSKGIAWGNGTTGAGQPLTLECTSCHNPHGNGQYRILVPVPSDGSGPLVEDQPAAVPDWPLPSGSSAAGVRNYTILWGRTLDDVVRGLYPGGGTTSTGGDYFRRYLPWNAVPGNSVAGVFGDRPMYVPSGTNPNTGWRAQMTAWCSSCHTRDDRVTGAQDDTGDPIFRYRHKVGSNPDCTVCHVAHGSNAQMPGVYSSSFPYPDNVFSPGPPPTSTDLSASSRLLKIDNRGTCQACHDPTKTVAPLTVSTPAPIPTP
ncbi:MAG: cytochrome c3 family protein [Candidatus Limnocylindrales bacterium]